MPVKKRIAKKRRPTFDGDVLRLFLRLERMPQDTHAFRRDSRELARQLNLESEWLCQTCQVNDDSAEPPWPPQYYATGVWYSVRAVRHALLDAVQRATAHKRPAGAPAPAPRPLSGLPGTTHGRPP